MTYQFTEKDFAEEVTRAIVEEGMSIMSELEFNERTLVDGDVSVWGKRFDFTFHAEASDDTEDLVCTAEVIGRHADMPTWGEFANARDWDKDLYEEAVLERFAGVYDYGKPEDFAKPWEWKLDNDTMQSAEDFAEEFLEENTYTVIDNAGERFAVCGAITAEEICCENCGAVIEEDLDEEKWSNMVRDALVSMSEMWSDEEFAEGGVGLNVEMNGVKTTPIYSDKVFRDEKGEIRRNAKGEPVTDDGLTVTQWLVDEIEWVACNTPMP